MAPVREGALGSAAAGWARVARGRVRRVARAAAVRREDMSEGCSLSGWIAEVCVAHLLYGAARRKDAGAT
jgi:hypothetical protein